MDLQRLFSERIISQISLNGHASDVWLVKTELGEYVARSSGVDDSVDAPFLWACRNLFGIELSNTFDMEYTNNLLNGISNNIAIPNVISKGIIDGRLREINCLKFILSNFKSVALQMVLWDIP